MLLEYNGQTAKMSTSKITDDPTKIEERFSRTDVAGLVDAAVQEFGDRLALAISLGVEDTILLHLVDDAAARANLRPRIFTLDTGRLPNESYEQLERLRERYRLPIEVYVPSASAIEDLYRRKGPLSFYASIDDRKECCAIRKVEPLTRALAGMSAWMTGLRRAQGPTRAELPRVERDGGLWKLSPLALLEDDETWALAKSLDVPVHPLHARGYPSIGCAPCTRAVAAGEPARAGRWWWEDPSLKECGIHTRGKS
jgi:phosphoadenosine phosphosulfate reductase